MSPATCLLLIAAAIIAILGVIIFLIELDEMAEEGEK